MTVYTYLRLMCMGSGLAGAAVILAAPTNALPTAEIPESPTQGCELPMVIGCEADSAVSGAVLTAATASYESGPFLGLFGDGADAPANCLAGTSDCNGGNGGLFFGSGGNGANGGYGGNAGFLFGDGGNGGNATQPGQSGGDGGNGGFLFGNGGNGGDGANGLLGAAGIKPTPLNENQAPLAFSAHLLLALALIRSAATAETDLMEATTSSRSPVSRFTSDSAATGAGEARRSAMESSVRQVEMEATEAPGLPAAGVVMAGTAELEAYFLAPGMPLGVTAVKADRAASAQEAVTAETAAQGVVRSHRPVVMVEMVGRAGTVPGAGREALEATAGMAVAPAC